VCLPALGDNPADRTALKPQELGEEIPPRQAAGGVGIDRLATITARSQVIHPAGKLDPQRPPSPETEMGVIIPDR
jgi:hypothetical protein